MSEPTITFGVNESGHIVYKARIDGVLLSKEEAERVASYISELKALARDMWFWGYEGHMDSESQDWQMKHIDGLLERMTSLGLLDGDAE